MAYYDIDGAANGNAHLRQALGSIQKQISALQKSQTAAPTTPPACTFSVTGTDTSFVVEITNPQGQTYLSVTQKQTIQSLGDDNVVALGVVHQIQSSTTRKYDAAGDVRSYGPSPATRVEIKDTPNQTRYFRMRSSYDNGKTYNAWREFIDPLLCGAQPVWSGLLKTSSTALVNSAAQTTDGLNALTQHLTSTQIDVAAKTWNVGAQKIAYLGGSVDPGAYGAWYVYGIDQKKKGGAITFLATQNTGTLTADDGLIIFGKITTSGGGGGTGGGGGSCHVAETMLAMFDGTEKDCSLIVRGDELLGTDGGKEIAQEDAEPVANVPCFAPEFSNGVKSKGVSSSEPIMLANGTFITVFDAMVGQQFQTKTGLATMTAKPFIGNKLVWRQRLDRTKTFWADGLGSHNLKP